MSSETQSGDGEDAQNCENCDSDRNHVVSGFDYQGFRGAIIRVCPEADKNHCEADDCNRDLTGELGAFVTPGDPADDSTEWHLLCPPAFVRAGVGQ